MQTTFVVSLFILSPIYVSFLSVSADGSNWIAVSKSVCRLGVFHVLTNIDTHLVARVPVRFRFDILVYMSILPLFLRICLILLFLLCNIFMWISTFFRVRMTETD
jgi:hypothetical protein